MAVYGYHRASTREQHLDRGIHEIQGFCKEHDLKLANIFTDQQTGKNFDRPRYTVLVEDVLRKEDIMIGGIWSGRRQSAFGKRFPQDNGASLYENVRKTL